MLSFRISAFFALVLIVPAHAATPDSLFEAAGRGDLPAVSALLAQGADVNARDAHGNSALAWAELSGDPETIEGRDKIEDSKPHLMGPIIWEHPLELGHPDVAARLVARGADVNAKDSHYGQTPLIWAAKNLQIGLVKLLLDKGADRTVQDKEGQTALTSASEFSPEILKLLVDWTAFGRDLNAPDQSQRTPLMYAAILDDVPHLQTLTRRGANVNFANRYGETALILAARGHNATVQFLLGHGANPNAGEKGGWNALLAASRFGDADTVKLLLQAGADPNVGTDPNGDTPLMAAAQTGDAARITLLLDKGADVNRADPYVHRTALLTACLNSQRDAALLLLDRGANANTKSDLNETPLAYACGYGQADLVKRLLDGGADPNVRPKSGGMTALYEAAQGGFTNLTTYPEIVRLLLAHGAAVGAKTDWGETALHAAERSHHAEVVALLQQAGAKE